MACRSVERLYDALQQFLAGSGELQLAGDSQAAAAAAAAELRLAAASLQAAAGSFLQQQRSSGMGGQSWGAHADSHSEAPAVVPRSERSSGLPDCPTAPPPGACACSA